MLEIVALVQAGIRTRTKQNAKTALKRLVFLINQFFKDLVPRLGRQTCPARTSLVPGAELDADTNSRHQALLFPSS